MLSELEIHTKDSRHDQAFALMQSSNVPGSAEREHELPVTSLSLAQHAVRGHSGDKAGGGQPHMRTSVIDGDRFPLSCGHLSDMPVGGGGQEGRECLEKSNEVIGAPGFPR